MRQHQHLTDETAVTEEESVLLDVESLRYGVSGGQLTSRQEAISPTETAPEEIERLGTAIRRQTAERLARMILLPAVPISVLLSLKQILGEEAFIRLCCNPSFLVSIFVSIGLALPCAALRNFHKAREAAVQLAEIEDVRVVGPLIDALMFGEDARVCAPAFRALVNLLPLLKASDAHLLTEAQRVVLRHVLTVQPSVCSVVAGGRSAFAVRRPQKEAEVHAQLQIAILKAFEQTGDDKALPVVERLASREAKTETQQQVKEAAMACLPFLLARTDQTRAQQTLLRAASNSAEDETSLLRGARGPAEADPQSLLRSNAQEEASDTANSADSQAPGQLHWAIITV